MRFRDGTPWFSMKGNNDWWERWTYDRSHSPVDVLRFRDGTKWFSMKGENDCRDMTSRRTGLTGKAVRGKMTGGIWPAEELVWRGRRSGRPGGGDCEAMLVVTNFFGLRVSLVSWLLPSCTGCRPGRVAYWWFVITPVLFFEYDWWLEACTPCTTTIVGSCLPDNSRFRILCN